MAKEIVKQAVSTDGTRTIADRREFSLKRFFLQWEWMLVLMLIVVNVFNLSASPNYANARNILNATRDFLDKAIVVFPMAFVLMLGEIDISVASTMALSATIMGVVYRAGCPMEVAIAAALATGTICGLINGVILVKFPELSSMIVTLATQIIYRGIASIILETNSVGGFPKWFGKIAAGKIGLVPYVLVFVVIEALFFAYLLHAVLCNGQLGNGCKILRCAHRQNQDNCIHNGRLVLGSGGYISCVEDVKCTPGCGKGI